MAWGDDIKPEKPIEGSRSSSLALEHWQFLEKWQKMIFIDAFIHGYKHGIEDCKKEK